LLVGADVDSHIDIIGCPDRVDVVLIGEQLYIWPPIRHQPPGKSA
jgi:hypothetical protein